ncbi:MAG TPA: M14 family metallopeptidase [Caulobacteraceae bacterium]|nr:M14 family metallopeptidase [Caulobacteraceae bacterium]
MNCADSFSDDYQEARAKFVTTAQAAGGVLARYANPNLGPDGRDLSTDVAWFGPRRAEKVLVLVSGTHGAEGFCGSGAQINWLVRGEVETLPTGVAALVVHAINPYGFAWLRRVTEENIDLNRNWIDFGGQLPENAAYDALAEAAAPREWTPESQQRSGAELTAFADKYGPLALQQALSGGQYKHPEGVFYGGQAPSWARRTQEQIYREYLGQAGHVAIIDYHTGLGPWGYAEPIMSDPAGTPNHVRGMAWYGNNITTPMDGSSTSAVTSGDNLTAAPRLLSHAAVTGIALEYGTLSLASVFTALRADAWLHAYGDPAGPEAGPIKQHIRAAFYGDADDWKGMVVGQSLATIRKAVRGLELS